MNLHSDQNVGPFRLAEVLGVGGMGEVWRAHHRRNGTAVAIKVITSDRALQRKYRESFLREVQAVAALNHPGVVAIYDYGELELDGVRTSLPWYAMEVAETSLAERTIGDWSTLRRILAETLDALAHAHARGVIHRDLKPENILLTAANDVKLTDFGMAHVVEMSDDTGRIFGPGGGTPDFMSPEQFRGQWRKFGPWTDLYAVGCLAWELATGAPPYTAETLMDIAVQHMSAEPPPLAPLFEVPERFEAWLRRLLPKHPLDRYRRAADAQWALVHDVGSLESVDPSEPGEQLRARPGQPTTASLEELDTFDGEPLPRTSDAVDTAGMTLQSSYGLAPPFPATWQTDHVASQLGGAGLGLFGIREIPFVGREEERELVWERLRAVVDGSRSELVLVRGDPGIGRTRFGQWISRRAHELGVATVVRATHGPIPNRSDGLSGAILRFLGIDGVDEERAEDIIFDRLGPTFDATLLIDLLFRRATDESHGTSTFAAPSQRYAAVERLFRQLAWERPVIFFADDLQWGADTLLFIQYLLGSKARTLVLGTVRSDSLRDRYWESQLLGELLQSPETTEVQLPVLSPPERNSLVQQMLDLEATLARRVTEWTQGIPLFAVQLVGDWVQRDLLQEAPGGFELQSEAEISLPDDVYTLWTQRIEELANSIGAPDVVEVLEVAAILGRSTDGEWGDVCDALGLEIPTGLEEELVTRGLAAHEDGGWSFQHGMLRESLERSAVESGRAQPIYDAAAEAVGAGDPYRFAEFQVRAGQLDAAVGALLPVLRSGIHSTAIGQSLQLVDAIRELLEEVDASPSDPRWGQLQESGVALLALSGEFSEAKELATSLVADAALYGWKAIKADAHLHLGIIGEFTSEPTRTVLEHFDEALSIFDELDDAPGRARGYRSLAQYQLANGKPSVASNLTRKALAIREEHDDRSGIVDCLAALGASTLAAGDVDEAESLFVRARTEAGREGLRHFLAEALDGLGQIAHRRGDLAEAAEYFAEAHEAWASIGSQAAHVAAAHLALVQLAREEYDSPQEPLAAALQAIRGGGVPHVAQAVLAGLMACAASERDGGAFDRHCDELSRHLERAGVARGDITVLDTVFRAGRLWADDGADRRRARRAYDLARNQFLALGAQRRADDVAMAIGTLRP